MSTPPQTAIPKFFLDDIIVMFDESSQTITQKNGEELNSKYVAYFNTIKHHRSSIHDWKYNDVAKTLTVVYTIVSDDNILEYAIGVYIYDKQITMSRMYYSIPRCPTIVYNNGNTAAWFYLDPELKKVVVDKYNIASGLRVSRRVADNKSNDINNVRFNHVNGMDTKFDIVTSSYIGNEYGRYYEHTLYNAGGSLRTCFMDMCICVLDGESYDGSDSKILRTCDTDATSPETLIQRRAFQPGHVVKMKYNHTWSDIVVVSGELNDGKLIVTDMNDDSILMKSNTMSWFAKLDGSRDVKCISNLDVKFGYTVDTPPKVMKPKSDDNVIPDVIDDTSPCVLYNYKAKCIVNDVLPQEYDNTIVVYEHGKRFTNSVKFFDVSLNDNMIYSVIDNIKNKDNIKVKHADNSCDTKKNVTIAIDETTNVMFKNEVMYDFIKSESPRECYIIKHPSKKLIILSKI